MFNKRELEIISLALMKRITYLKQLFEETKELDLVEQIEETKNLLEKVLGE